MYLGVRRILYKIIAKKIRKRYNKINNNTQKRKGEGII